VDFSGIDTGGSKATCINNAQGVCKIIRAFVANKKKNRFENNGEMKLSAGSVYNDFSLTMESKYSIALKTKGFQGVYKIKNLFGI